MYALNAALLLVTGCFYTVVLLLVLGSELCSKTGEFLSGYLQVLAAASQQWCVCVYVCVTFSTRVVAVGLKMRIFKDHILTRYTEKLSSYVIKFSFLWLQLPHWQV